MGEQNTEESGASPTKGKPRGGPKPLKLEDEKGFFEHPWVESLVPTFQRDQVLAEEALKTITDDVGRLNDISQVKAGQKLFTTIEGRPKSQLSFFRKLFSTCTERSKMTGVTPATLLQFYRSIHDLAGVRFACPYFDDIEPAIKSVRDFLRLLGYATDIQDELPDKNYLDLGDSHGYRSYHFFVRVPTKVSIYDDVELCLCEVQVRSELQHVWAKKSHDLLYKPGSGWQPTDAYVLEDMKQLSNSLRAADHHLSSIRKRARGL